MLVYRVESHDGTGVYKHPYYDTTDCYGPDHPAPKEDGLPEEFSWLYQFAFRSISQLNAWFNRDVRDEWALYMKERLSKLHQDDLLFIAVYDVPLSKIMFGGRQLIFIKKEATLISRKIINTFEDALLVT